MHFLFFMKNNARYFFQLLEQNISEVHNLRVHKHRIVLSLIVQPPYIRPFPSPCTCLPAADS
jgi:hypothetical protein